MRSARLPRVSSKAGPDPSMRRSGRCAGRPRCPPFRPFGENMIDWEELTGQSHLVVDLVSIPIFSAIAGLITNWTGVLMLFAPVHFTGFHLRGLQPVFRFLPRKAQILPIFAPGGVLGFQGSSRAAQRRWPASSWTSRSCGSAGSPTSTRNSSRRSWPSSWPTPHGPASAVWPPTCWRTSTACCGRCCRHR